MSRSDAPADCPQGHGDTVRLLSTVAVAGTLRTANGVGTFALDSAHISGVPVPKYVLQELVSYYSKTPTHPEGVGLDESFPLPASIRQIDVGAGQAVVVQ